MKEKLDDILLLDWDEEDKNCLLKIVEGIIYFKRLIPKSFEKEIVKCLDICIREKKQLDKLRLECSCLKKET